MKLGLRGTFLGILTAGLLTTAVVLVLTSLDSNRAMVDKLLDEIVPATKKTADLVQEITSASEEQATGIGQVNSAMNQLNQITQQNASASEELAAIAEEMSSQAENLQQLMAFFDVGQQHRRLAQPVLKRGPLSPIDEEGFGRF